MVAQQDSPCLCKEAVRHHWSPDSVIVVQTSGREPREPRAGISPGAGALTPARRETVLQQARVYLHLFYINASPSQRIRRAQGALVSPCSGRLLGAFSLQQEMFGCRPTAVKLTPVFLCCDLGKRVSGDVFELCCSSCFPWSSHFVCVFVPRGGRQRCK